MRSTMLAAAVGCLSLGCLSFAGAEARAWTVVPSSPEAMCGTAIQGVQPTSGLPQHLLMAIGRVESGRYDPRSGSVQPWPWSINAEGKGASFATRGDAMAAVVALQARGVKSIDVGCMQINLMHHPRAFDTLDEAFDPAANVRYATRFLTDLHAETKDWALAAAYYHSRSLEFAAPYQQKILAAIPGGLPGGTVLVASGASTRLAGAVRPPPLTVAWQSTLASSVASPGDGCGIFRAQDGRAGGRVAGGAVDGLGGVGRPASFDGGTARVAATTVRWRAADPACQPALIVRDPSAAERTGQGPRQMPPGRAALSRARQRRYSWNNWARRPGDCTRWLKPD